MSAHLKIRLHAARKPLGPSDQLQDLGRGAAHLAEVVLSVESQQQTHWLTGSPGCQSGAWPSAKAYCAVRTQSGEGPAHLAKVALGHVAVVQVEVRQSSQEQGLQVVRLRLEDGASQLHNACTGTQQLCSCTSLCEGVTPELWCTPCLD